jgi:hypothetical protein
LAIIDHFVYILRSGASRLAASRSGGTLLSDQVSHMIRLLLLAVRQLFGCLRHVVQAARGVLLLCASQQIGSLAQTVCGTARIGRAGGLGRRALHVFVGLAQAVERLLGRLLAVIGCLVRGLLRIRRARG